MPPFFMHRPAQMRYAVKVAHRSWGSRRKVIPVSDCADLRMKSYRQGGMKAWVLAEGKERRERTFTCPILRRQLWGENYEFDRRRKEMVLCGGSVYLGRDSDVSGAVVVSLLQGRAS